MIYFFGDKMKILRFEGKHTILVYKGYKFINLSPHPLVFEDGVTLEPYDMELAKKVYATPVEENKNSDDVFVKTVFKKNEESEKILRELNKMELIPISSIINAQAYPSLCVSPIVTPETARSPPEQKRVQYKFNIY